MIQTLNLKLSLVFTVLFAAMTYASYVEAASKSPFKVMAGSWRGSGKIKPPGGETERVRCRVRYRVYSSGNKVNQVIKCAGSGYWITATSKLRYTPGNRKIRGTWSAKFGDKGKPKETSGGSVVGDYINNTISISLISDKRTGNMSVKMNGKRSQTVIINSLAHLELRR